MFSKLIRQSNPISNSKSIYKWMFKSSPNTTFLPLSSNQRFFHTQHTSSHHNHHNQQSSTIIQSHIFQDQHSTYICLALSPVLSARFDPFEDVNVFNIKLSHSLFNSDENQNTINQQHSSTQHHSSHSSNLTPTPTEIYSPAGIEILQHYNVIKPSNNTNETIDQNNNNDSHTNNTIQQQHTPFWSLWIIIKRNIRDFLIWMTPRTWPSYQQCCQDLLKSSFIITCSLTCIFMGYLLQSRFDLQYAFKSIIKIIMTKAYPTILSIPSMFALISCIFSFNRLRDHLEQDKTLNICD